MPGIEERLKITRSTMEALYNWSTEASEKAAKQDDENTARYKNARTEVIDRVLEKEIEALRKKSSFRFDLERKHLEEVKARIEEQYGKELNKLSEIDQKRRSAALEGIKVREKEINTAEKMDILGKKGGPIQSVFGMLGLPQLGSVAIGQAKTGEVLGALTGTVGAFAGALAGISVPTSALAFFGESLKAYGDTLREGMQIFKALSGGMSNLKFSSESSADAALQMQRELANFAVDFGTEGKKELLDAMASLSSGLYRHGIDANAAATNITELGKRAVFTGLMIGISGKQYADALGELRVKYNMTEVEAIDTMALFAKGVENAGTRFGTFWNALQSVEGRLRPLGFTIADTSGKLMGLTKAIDAGVISADDFSKALSAPQEVPEDAMAFMINQIVQGAGGKEAQPLREELNRYQGNLLMQMEVFRAAAGGERQETVGPMKGKIVRDTKGAQMGVAIQHLLESIPKELAGPILGGAQGELGKLATHRWMTSQFQPGLYGRDMPTDVLRRRGELQETVRGIVPSDALVRLTDIGDKSTISLETLEKNFGITNVEVIHFRDSLSAAGEAISKNLVAPTERFKNAVDANIQETANTLKNFLSFWGPGPWDDFGASRGLPAGAHGAKKTSR